MVFLNYLINGISLGSIYAIIALGYTMVYGIAKMLNFAHGDVIMVGAYICFFSMNGLSSLFAPGSLAALVVPALAGTVLAFARALGEYGATSMIAGYTPGKTATIATTVYQLWRTNDELGAMRWVLVDIAISAVVLLAVNLLEKKQKAGGRK